MVLDAILLEDVLSLADHKPDVGNIDSRYIFREREGPQPFIWGGGNCSLLVQAVLSIGELSL